MSVLDVGKANAERTHAPVPPMRVSTLCPLYANPPPHLPPPGYAGIYLYDDSSRSYSVVSSAFKASASDEATVDLPVPSHVHATLLDPLRTSSDPQVRGHEPQPI